MFIMNSSKNHIKIFNLISNNKKSSINKADPHNTTKLRKLKVGKTEFRSRAKKFSHSNYETRNSKILLYTKASTYTKLF